MRKVVIKGFQLGIGIILSCFFLYLSYQKIGGLDFSKLNDTSINYIYIFFALTSFIISVCIRALLWHKCLYKPFSLGLSLRAIFLGMAANMVLPFRMGEVVKLGVFQRGYNKNKGQDSKTLFIRIGANIVIERIMDGIVLILLAVLGLYFIDFNIEIKERIGLIRNTIILILIISVIIISIIAKLYKSGRYKWKWAEKIDKSLHGFTLKETSIKAFIAGIFLLFSWFFGYLSVFFTLLSVEITFDVSKYAAYVIFIMTNIAILFPAAPGGLGLFEYACIYSLDMFGVTGIIAGVTAIIIHIIQYGAVIPVAFYMLIRYNDFIFNFGNKKK